MADKLADARRSLLRAQEAGQKRLAELDDERREIKASLKSLEAALKALGASPRPQAGQRTKAKDNLGDQSMDPPSASPPGRSAR